MTVRELDDDVKRRFVEKARRNGVSTEAYHRDVIRRAAFAEEDEAEEVAAAEWVARVRKPLTGLRLDDEGWEDIERALDHAAASRGARRASDQFR